MRVHGVRCGWVECGVVGWSVVYECAWSEVWLGGVWCGWVECGVRVCME